MRRIISILVLVSVICVQNIHAQMITNYRYGVKYNQNEGSNGPKLNTNQYDLKPGTFSYRLSTAGGPTNYHDRTGWNSDPYTQGYLMRTQTTPNQFKQNYRLLYPNNYNPNLEEGYPIIVMLHGAGERGNCWNNNCYFAGQGWDPETNSPQTAGPGLSSENLLNNDHNLVHGGKPHLDAVNRAGSKLLGDPTLAYNAYPGFVLFPQNTNGWDGNSIKETIRIIHKVLDENNINRNKVVVHGLSNGAQHVVTLVKYDPAMFAGVLLMSPSSANTKVKDSYELANIPFWVFQGGKDNNPTVSQTNSLVRFFQEMGGTIEYNIYDNLGHGTWNTAYAEDNFFPWIKEKDKSDMHVFFGDSTICASNGNGAKLGVSHGFHAYEWERDGQIIDNADSSVYFADIPGVYRVRFARFDPGNNNPIVWNNWSKPVTIRESVVSKPEITALNTVHLPDINGVDSVGLVTPLNSDLYYTWYKDGAIVGDTNFYNVKSAGVYTVSTETLGGCPSANADAYNITFNAPTTVTSPTSLTATLTSTSKVRLNWEDNSGVETAYEVYRSTSDPGFYKFLARLPEDAISYLDGTVTSNDDYYYKIRAVSYDAVSNYTAATFVASGVDNEAPSTPINLAVDNYTLTTASLSWEASTDNEAVKEYIIYYSSDSILTGSTSTSFEVTGLKEGRTFGFTVRAVDFGGNLSLASNQANVTTIFEGLTYEHSTGAYSSLTEIDWSFVEYFGKVDNFGLDERTQDDFFSFKFDGYINITEADNYQFRSKSDDGSRVYIGGFDPQSLNTNLVFDNDGTHGNNYGSDTPDILSLSTGAYPITVLYFENGGGQNLQVEVKKGSGSWQIIPNAMLKSGTIVVNDPPEAATNLTATSTGLSTIDLSWDHTELIPDNTKIVVLGSSTAEGTGASPIDSAWVNRLDYWLGQNSGSYSLTNLAVGGFTTYHIRPDGSDNGSNPNVDTDHNITKALSLNPDYLIINLPSNNAASEIPAATTMAHYREIKALADQAGVKTFIISPQPRNFGPSSPKRVVLLAELDSVRAGFGNYVIDVFDSLADDDENIEPSLNAGDGIHLNNDGHAYIFSEVQAKLLSHLTHYDVYRSNTSGGSFSLLGAVNNGDKSFTDGQLTAGATYYYKVKAVNKNGESPYSNEANATNSVDTEAPSVPQNLVVINTTYTNSSFTWDVSTDNDQVAYYEVKANDDIIGTSLDNTFYTEILLPDSSYDVSVRAYDRTGNASTYSTSVNVVSDEPNIYFSKSSGDLNTLATWGKNNDGSGDAPSSFSLNGQIFKIANRTNSAVASDWTIGGLISKVVVTENETVSLNANLTGKIQVMDNATVAINGSDLPTFEESAANSTVVLNNFTQVPSGKFGHLTLNGTGIKNVSAGVHTLKGDLTVASGITLKGSTSNNSKIEVGGDVHFLGSLADVAQDNRLALNFTGGKQHQLNMVSGVSLYELTASANDIITLVAASKTSFTTGSQKGGGVKLGNGAMLDISDNELKVIGAGSLNAENTSGSIAINRGDIGIETTSNLDSHLNFDTNNNSVENISLNLTGNGRVFLETPMSLYALLDLPSGEFNTNGHLTLKSDAIQTAMISELPIGATITGNLKAERYVDPMKAYRYMGTPVSGVTVADWQNFFPITGDFTGANTGANLATSASMYRYSESEGGWLAHPAASTDNNVAIEVGTGYAPFIRDAVNDLTIVNEGSPTQGDFTFTLSGGTGGVADDGWNLLANPYPAAVEWNQTDWVSSGISDIISVADNTPGESQFIYYDRTEASEIIASGQGFWVQAVTSSPSLTITEQAKATAVDAIETPYYRTTVSAMVNYLRFSLKELSSGKEDETTIKFSSDGENIYNKAKDGFKRPNEIINFYSLTADDQKVAINSMSDAFCQEEVKLGMYNVSDGNYQIDFKNVVDFNIAEATLIDNYLKDTVLLNSNIHYDFTVDLSVDESYGDDRFSLLLTRPTINVETPITYVTDHCLGSAVSVSITDAQHGAVYVLKDSIGQIIGQQVVANSSAIELMIPAGVLPAGSHEFQVEAQYSGCSSAILNSTVAIQMKSIQTPNIVKEVVETCEGIAIVLYATGAGVDETYTWYEAYSGITYSNTSNTLLVDTIEEDIAVFNVSIISALGCESATSAVIEIGQEELIPVPLETSKNLVYSEVLCADQTFELIIEDSQAGIEYALADLSSNRLSEWTMSNGGNQFINLSVEELADSIQMKLLVRYPSCDFVEMEETIELVKIRTETPVLSKAIVESCQNNVATLTATTNATHFNWYYPDLNHPLDQHAASIVVTDVDSVGNYYVTAVNANGCESLDYDYINLSQEELYVEQVDLDVSVENTFLLCEDDRLDITIISPQLGVSYYVINENGIIMSDTLEVDTSVDVLDLTIEASFAAGDYLWTVMAFKPTCEAMALSQQVDFSVYNYPSISLDQYNYSLCTGDTVSVSQPDLADGNYIKWFNSEGVEVTEASDLEFVASAPGIYEFFLKGYNELGCSNEESLKVVFEVNTVVQPIIENVDQTLIINNLFGGEQINWFLNGEWISSQASVSLLDAGVYYAEVEMNDCFAVSDYFEYIITSNDKPFTAADVLIYPNPTLDFTFTLSGDALIEEDVDISLYDAFGRKIYEKTFDKASFQRGANISLKGQSPNTGVYLVTIQQGTQMVIKKIVMK